MSTYIIDSEPEATAGADADELLIYDASAAGTRKLGLDTLRTYIGSQVVAIPDAATYTVLAANSGKVHTIPNLTADTVITLPTPANGLQYEFIYAGVAADAQDWALDTGSNTNFYLGGVVHLDTDAGSAGDEVVPVAGDGNSNSILNVLVPDVGTCVRLICDGTNWIASGKVVSATAPTYADQA